MRHVLSSVLVLSVLAQSPAAQSSPADRDAVLAVVQKFFDTMAAGDVAGMRAISVAEAAFVIVRPASDGNPAAVRVTTNQASFDRMAGDTRKLRERMWNPDVRVHGTIAVVWTPYDFWIDGKFSHCGVDAFNLVKTPEGWKMAGGTYTIERTGCAPSPLGPIK